MRKPQLLIVEDDADLREALQRFLEERGFDVRTAANGREGMVQVAQSRPHLIVLDLRMPVMDGEDMMNELCRRKPDTVNIPLLVLTNLSASVTTSSIFNQFVQIRFLVKSNVELSDVATTVENLLHRVRKSS